MDIEVRHDQRGHKGAFRVDGPDGEPAAEMTYSRAGERLVIIDHTEVSDVLRGTGAGKKMVHAAVAWARADGLRILPLCPFARSVFDKDPTLHDVLSR